MMKRLTGLSGQKGITGLETAIILIAFVMVASVFAYVVLTAGLFSSQKAKEAVYSGLQEVGNTMELKGSVLLKMDESGIGTDLLFTIACPGSSNPIDFTGKLPDGKNTVVISYTDAYQNIPDMDWTLNKLTTINSDNLLDPSEMFQIDVDLSAVNDGADSDNERLGGYHKFIIEVVPPSGAVLTIERTVPARTDAVVSLN
jgi:archaeal flagellin FlaB